MKHIVNGFFKNYLKKDDEVLITLSEHASNILPWFILQKEIGIKVKYIPLNENHEVTIDNFKKSITNKTKVVSLAYVTNVVGDERPIKEISKIAHDNNILVVVDAAQGIPHKKIDVQKDDIDFMAFSGHKMYGPMGIGVFYGKEKWLEALPPFLSGGEMIDTVTPEKVTFNVLPFKFEAGTPNVAGAIGLGAAIDYLQQFDQLELQKYEDDLLAYGLSILAQIPDLTVYGTPARRSSILPFNVSGIQHYDMGVLLDTMGIAVRTGQHCTQPIMDALHISGTVRASLALYNDRSDLEKLAEGVRRAIKMLRR